MCEDIFPCKLAAEVRQELGDVAASISSALGRISSARVFVHRLSKEEDRLQQFTAVNESCAVDELDGVWRVGPWSSGQTPLVHGWRSGVEDLPGCQRCELDQGGPSLC